MTEIDYLGAIRRRKVLVVACVIVSVLVAWLTTEAKPPVERQERASVYSATAILLASPGPDTGFGGMNTLAALTKIGEVPDRVAEALDQDDPLGLAAAITTIADAQTRLLTISALAQSPARAEELANTFADELVRYQRQQLAAVGMEDVPSNGALKLIQRGEAHSGRPVAISAPVVGQGPTTPDGPQFIAGEGRPEEVATELARSKLLETGWRVPPGHPVRLSVAAALGLLLAGALAVLLDRFDSKLRDRKRAEEAFGVPVLSEIPKIGRRERRSIGTILTGSPHSAAADAFRLLGAALNLRTEPEKRWLEAGPPAQTILITSALRGEGKTTVAANLAASLSEVGKKVIVASVDMRNPAIHTVMGAPPSDAVVEAGSSHPARSILPDPLPHAAVGSTLIPVVSSSVAPERPARVLASRGFRRAIDEARGIADYVILDGPPLTTTSDATFLLPYVDAVLIVAHAEKSTADRAAIASQILERLHAPVKGVVLNATSSSKRRYTAYRSPGPRKETGRSRSRGFPQLARHRKGD